MGMSSLLGAGISGAASIFGASQQASAAKKAAQIQAQTAQQAMQLQKGMFDTTQNNLRPYMDTGAAASRDLGYRIQNDFQQDIPLPDQLTKPMDQATLEATPGYQFTLAQGLKATQNSAAARGLGISGAALKGAANYATGLSDQTYNTRFDQNMRQGQQIWSDQVANRQNAFNRLMGVSQMGAGAAGGLGQTSAQVGANMGSNLIQSGNAQAAGINGAAAAWNSGINGVSNALTGGLNQYQMYNRLQGGGGLGSIMYDGAGASWT